MSKIMKTGLYIDFEFEVGIVYDQCQGEAEHFIRSRTRWM